MSKPSVNGVSLYLPGLSATSHKLLDSLITRAGFQREQFGEMDSLSHPTNTKVILAFGEDALRMWSGEIGIMRYRGHVLGSYPLVITTFEPSFLLPRKGEESSTKYTGVVINDIRNAVRVAREGFRREPVSYLIDPSPQVAADWVQAYEDSLAHSPTETFLAHDLETEYKSKNSDESELEVRDNLILRVGFAYRDREALTIPWTAPYLDVIHRLYENTGAKVGWNSSGFDLPVLEGNGISPRGEQYDAIDAWHVFQCVLPRKLEFVAGFYSDLLPWKHTNKSNFALYNAKDVDATIRIWNGLRRDMQAMKFNAVENAA